MGMDIEFMLPTGRFVEVERSDGETTVFDHSDHWQGRLPLFVAGETGHGLMDLRNDELREVAADLAALEWDPSFADEYAAIDDRDDFEYYVTMIEAYARAGGTVRGSV